MTGKRLTESDFRDAAAARGYIWLGSGVPFALEKTEWQCPKGHRWLTRYNSLTSGDHGCPTCAHEHVNDYRRLTEYDYASVGEARGIAWIGSSVPLNTAQKTTWKCAHGHIWQAPYTSLYMGRGCRICGHIIASGKQRKNASDYHSLAQNNGLDWIGALPPNMHTETMWRCKNGHEFSSDYKRIADGSTCSICSLVRPRTLADYNQLAASRGFAFIDQLPKNTESKGKWRCSNGHEFLTAFRQVSGGHGCPLCASPYKRGKAAFEEVAAAHGFKWVGVSLPKHNGKTTWECENGHRWDALFNSIKSGRGCPFCVNMVNGVYVSKPQLTLHAMLGGNLNYRVGRYAIDIALTMDTHRIGIEYDCQYWHKGKEKHEAKRDAYLIGLGWHMLHIKTNILLPTREQLDAALTLLVNGATYAEIVLADWRG